MPSYWKRKIDDSYLDTVLFLFNGQTGVEHNKVRKELEKSINRQKKTFLDKCHNEKIEVGFRPFFKTYNLEDVIKERGSPFVDTLKEDKASSKIDLWQGAYLEILDRIKREHPFYAAIFLHGLWFSEEEFFCPLDLNLITKGLTSIFRTSEEDKQNANLDKKVIPSRIITLIDDIDIIQTRIKERSTQNGSFPYDIRVDFSLKELTTWRNFEITMGRSLAHLIYGQFRGFNYTFSVRHPIHALRDLILNPDCVTLYSAFPISGIRNNENCILEIDTFVEKLSKKYIILNPLTIDEFTILVPIITNFRKQIVDFLKNELKKKGIKFDKLPAIRIDLLRKYVSLNDEKFEIVHNKILFKNFELTINSKTILLPEFHILDIPFDFTLENKKWSLYTNFKQNKKSIVEMPTSFNLLGHEILEVITDIGSRVRHRDLLIIESCDGIIAYRPYFNGKPSSGVYHELDFSRMVNNFVAKNYIRIFKTTSEDEKKFDKTKTLFVPGFSKSFVATKDDKAYTTAIKSFEEDNLFKRLKDFQKKKKDVFISQSGRFYLNYQDLIPAIYDWYSFPSQNHIHPMEFD